MLLPKICDVLDLPDPDSADLRFIFEVVPPAPDLRPLWCVWRPGDDGESLRIELVAWCDTVSVARRVCHTFGEGLYKFTTSLGEQIASFDVPAIQQGD